MLNTTQLVNKMIAEGKAKIDTCEFKDCTNHELLYKVKDKFVCGSCLDFIGTVLNTLERGE
jgi:hypothetical protein